MAEVLRSAQVTVRVEGCDVVVRLDGKEHARKSFASEAAAWAWRARFTEGMVVLAAKGNIGLRVVDRDA